MTAPEGSPESIPLPGLAELRGEWRGTLEASGGGDGDTYVRVIAQQSPLTLAFSVQILPPSLPMKLRTSVALKATQIVVFVPCCLNL